MQRFTQSEILSLPKINNTQIQVIEGSLLGDGSLTGCNKYPNRNWYFRKCQSKFSHSGCDKIDYMQWHINELNPYSKTNIYEGKYKSKRICGNKNITKESQYYCIRTCSNEQLTNLAKKWYVKISDKLTKIVPNDLILTPLMLSVWYCDDGCNVPTTRTINLCTDSFTINEVDYLVESMKRDLGIESYLYLNFNKKPNIRIRTHEYINFIDIVKSNFNWNCFNYKIDTSKYIPPKPKACGEKSGNSKMTEEKVIQLLKEKSEGETYKNLSKKFNISESTVWHIISRKTWKHVVIT